MFFHKVFRSRIKQSHVFINNFQKIQNGIGQSSQTTVARIILRYNCRPKISKKPCQICWRCFIVQAAYFVCLLKYLPTSGCSRCSFNILHYLLLLLMTAISLTVSLFIPFIITAFLLPLFLLFDPYCWTVTEK